MNERCEADGASVKRTPEETLVMSVEVLSHSGHFIRRFRTRQLDVVGFVEASFLETPRLKVFFISDH